MFSAAAELSDIAEASKEGLVVSNVFQKAGISVTEIGTVAYVATGEFCHNIYVHFYVLQSMFLILQSYKKTTVHLKKVLF